MRLLSCHPRAILSGILLMACALTFSGCFEKKTGTVLARFDGTVITEPELLARAGRLPKELASQMLKNKKEFLEDLINEHYMLKEALRRNLHKQKDVAELIDAARDKILIAKLVELEVDNKVTLSPEEVADYYKQRQSEFMTPLVMRASQIVADTQEDAEAIRRELAQGADFEELARKRSTDATAAKGGDIGYFQKGMLIPEFEKVAFQLQPGQISNVFKTNYGYHILVISERREPAVRSFASVKGAIERQLLNQKRSKAYKNYIQGLKTDAKIEINDDILKETKNENK